jgi:hypothetical protein
VPVVEERYEVDLARSAAVLDGVDRALSRLSDDTYGSCEVCGAPIRGADLEADPTQRVCEQHLALEPHALHHTPEHPEHPEHDTPGPGQSAPDP